jgi:hypothetical protein
MKPIQKQIKKEIVIKQKKKTKFKKESTQKNKPVHTSHLKRCLGPIDKIDQTPKTEI